MSADTQRFAELAAVSFALRDDVRKRDDRIQDRVRLPAREVDE